MNWTEVSIHTSREAVEAVSNFLQELGAGGVAIEDPEVLLRDWSNPYGELIALKQEDYPKEGVRIKAYFPETVKISPVVEQLKEHLKRLPEFGLDPGKATIETAVVDEENWANEWKKYYKPLQVTSRLTIKPVWEEYAPKSSDEIIVELEPGMAFGTGTHPTTMLSLKLLEKYLVPGQKVIDVGCGSGILSIAAGKMGAGKVLAFDLDPVAVHSAEYNVKLNRLEHLIYVREGDLLKSVSERADLVISNILAEIIVRLIPDLPRVLVPGGMFLASGIVEEKIEEILQSLKINGLSVLETIHQDGWVAICAKKW